MRAEVAERLDALDAEFYHTQAHSFSDTRRTSWAGWQRCMALVGEVPAQARVLDVACGNLRFARFLQDAWPGAHLTYDAVDRCPELLGGWAPPSSWCLRYQWRDVVADLANGVAQEGGDGYDLVVCFGFLHHVPGGDARRRLVRGLVGRLRPGGLCCVSLWRFLDDEGLARKAEATTAQALGELGIGPSELDRGDRLLGWQGQPQVWRYCHGFDDAETDMLVSAALSVGDVTLAARFRADGRTGKLNEYLVFQKEK